LIKKNLSPFNTEREREREMETPEWFNYKATNGKVRCTTCSGTGVNTKDNVVFITCRECFGSKVVDDIDY
jgi:DnaJ-class molecular chaperone